MEIQYSYRPESDDRSHGAPEAGHRRRLRLVFGAFLGLFGIISLGLLRVHTSPDSYLTEEELCHIGAVELRVSRGEICDRSGNLLAKDRQVSSLWVDPRCVVDPEMTALTLSEQLGLDTQEVRIRLTPRDPNNGVRKFAWIKRWMSDRDVEAFNNLDPILARRLSLKNELTRFYPEGELAAHILGFVNKDGVGSDGIEMAYDKHLRCTPGKRKVRVDARRRMLESLTLEYIEQEGGENVYLTIDKGIQRTLEQELDRGMAENKAPRGMGMLMDPKTGAILAMACRPAYNPNEYWAVPSETYKNRAVVDVFEPGSSFKIVTFSGALEQGIVKTTDIMNCEGGYYTVAGHRIKDFHKFGRIPIWKCFAESSNIATIKIAGMLEKERLETWVKRFGFGQKTSPDFALESRGIVHPRAEWSKSTMGAIPIGQEIAVTMPQLVRAFGVIANGGFLIEPYLVEKVVDTDGVVVYQHQPKPPERVLSDETARIMKELCHLVVKEGTGMPASIPEYRVGGKTGTAQIARPDHRGFYADKYTAIFAGFAPVSAPKVCGVIIIQEPDIKLHYGGSVCGPLFKNVVRDTLIRMNCPVDPVTEEGKEGKPPQIVAKKSDVGAD